MTSFFVHRRADGTIASAHEEMQPGYAEEIVDLAAPGMEIFRPPPAYIALRRAAYPSIGDQLDAIWKGGQARDEMKALIDAVKSDYPKTEK
jgi:hypothetical protein